MSPTAPGPARPRRAIRKPALRSPALRSPALRSPAIRNPSIRNPAIVVLLVVLVAVAMAVLAGGSTSRALDPRAVNPSGTRALAQVLRAQGVTVRLVTSTARLLDLSGPGDLVVVAIPDRPGDTQAAAVAATGADLVLVAAREPRRWVRGVRSAEPVPFSVQAPGCRLPAAVRAGRAAAGGLGYRVTSADADLCYAQEGPASVVVLRSGSRTVCLLGTGRPLTNEHLDEEGNAALALGLLGARPQVLWFLPGLDDVPDNQRVSFYGLVPHGIWWALGQAVIAVVLLALWRARRLGALVVEPLPVVVRAAEAVEGRARLYRRSRAWGTAAEALRAGSRSRLATLLGLPRRAAPTTVVDAVAARTFRAAVDVHGLLYGAPPPDDRALVRLADDLDILEREIRRP